MPPSAAHWFGTDDLGRDIFSRIVYGARLTLFVVILVAVIAAPIGLLVGTVAGYAGGWIDTVLMRVTDVFLAFPKLVLALAFVAALGPGIENAVHRDRAHLLAALCPHGKGRHADGAQLRLYPGRAADGRLAVAHRLRHVVPLCLPSLIVRVTLDMAGIILTAAGLGFLGLGAQPPLPEWGAMIASGRRFSSTNGGSPARPGSPFCWSVSVSTCSATGCAMSLDPQAGGQ